MNKMQTHQKKELVEILSSYVTSSRLAKMKAVLSRRTRHLTIVLEDIYQSHNASAVIRSCDCFGVQDVHIIENRNKYTVNPDVALGASKWLSLRKYNKLDFNTTTCLAKLKKQGYQLIATTPHKDDCLLEELPVQKKTALLFGTEMQGLTPEAISMADGFTKIPMEGFTESFNISVSVAISLYHLTHKIKQDVSSWQLSDNEQLDVMLEWLMQSVKNAEGLVNQLYP
jgi:tRNA (guanosine-2'-O-)-methyltransferase